MKLVVIFYVLENKHRFMYFTNGKLISLYIEIFILNNKINKKKTKNNQATVNVLSFFFGSFLRGQT